MSHVFISYSHEDKDFVAKLIEYCQIANIDVWLDKADLKAGEYWSPQIDEAITNAFGIILIISPSSSVSPYVTYEWAFAKGLGKKIIPVLCKTVNIDTQLGTEIDTIKQKYGVKLPKPQTHPDFILSHHIDLSNQNNTPQNWRELINQIQGVLDNFLLTNLSPKAPDVVKNAYKNFFSPNGTERENAVLSLSFIESSYAEDALILGLDCDYPDVRYLSAEKLGNKGSIKAIPKLSRLVEDSNDDVRRFTITALIRIGGNEVVPGLIKALKDKDRENVKKAIKALGNIGHSDAVTHLIQIEDTDYQVRQAIYQALGQIGDEQALSYLIAHSDKSPHDTTIIKSLGEIGGIDAIQHLIKRIEYVSNHIRQSVFEALVNIGEKAVPYLIEGLQHQHIDVRKEITEILVQIGGKAVPYLIQALQHQSGYVRRGVIEVLKRLNTPEAQEALKRHR